MKVAPRAAMLAGIMSLLAAGGGCTWFHRAPQPPAVVIPEPPILFVTSPPTTPPEAPPAELLPIELAGDPPVLLVATLEMPPPPRPGPVSHHEGEVARSEQHPEAAPPNSPTPPPPQLSAGLSPAQQAASREQTRAVLDRAQHDLKILNDRRLDGNAAATRDQAREYVRQAQQALDQGDLIRAGTLAEKAETMAGYLLRH